MACAGTDRLLQGNAKQGINPILGSEFTHTDHADDRGVKIGDGTIDGTDKRYYHLTVLLKTMKGIGTSSNYLRWRLRTSGTSHAQRGKR